MYVYDRNRQKRRENYCRTFWSFVCDFAWRSSLFQCQKVSDAVFSYFVHQIHGTFFRLFSVDDLTLSVIFYFVVFVTHKVRLYLTWMIEFFCLLVLIDCHKVWFDYNATMQITVEAVSHLKQCRLIEVKLV